MLWLHIIQYAGFALAQVTNATLVYLIRTRAKKLFGTYRHVMATFAMYSLIYAWIEVMTQPVMHINGPIFIVYMDSPMKYYTWIGNDITCLYCGSFALVISLLAAQFFYRYVAMCRQDLLPKIEGFKLILIFVPCLICFVLWFEFVYWGMANTEEKQLYMKDELKFHYDEDATKVSFIAPMYWSIGEHGEKLWKFGEIMSSVGCVVIIVVCFSTILFCAFNIYWTMKNASCHMSTKTLELNRQLFITLTFQTILPFIMMYSPVGLFITLPFFEVNIGKFANYVGASLAVYPSLEPLIAIFCIKEFKRTLFAIYCGLFAFCISMLTVHFIYRYFAVCKSRNLRYFSGYRLYLWFSIPLISFLIWASDTHYSQSPDQFKIKYFRNVTMEIYGENIEQIAFIGVVYYEHFADGSKAVRLPDLFSAGLISTIITLSFSTCSLCALKTYRKMNDVSNQMSNRTRSLNKQLFWTLGLQTFLPCLTQYCPVGLLFLLPFFEIEVGKLGNLVGVTCCLYPAMDPLIAIFIIDRFRECLFERKIVVNIVPKTILSISSSAFRIK